MQWNYRSLHFLLLFFVVHAVEINETISRVHSCSRADSRLIRNYFHSVVLKGSVVENLLLDSCPFHSKNDIFSHQEQNKIEQYRGEWQVNNSDLITPIIILDNFC
jgi:hypothetical protein